MALATSCVFFKGLSSTKGAKALLGRAGLIFSDSRKCFGTKCSESRTSLEFLLIKICLPTSFFFFFFPGKEFKGNFDLVGSTA